MCPFGISKIEKHFIFKFAQAFVFRINLQNEIAAISLHKKQQPVESRHSQKIGFQFSRVRFIAYYVY